MRAPRTFDPLPLRELERRELLADWSEENASGLFQILRRFPNVRVRSIHMDGTTSDTLDAYAERYCISKTETMRRAMAALLREEDAR